MDVKYQFASAEHKTYFKSILREILTLYADGWLTLRSAP